MKALTLTQPWATLVMLGEKRVETRKVLFKHRGPLAIHASRHLDEDECMHPAFREALAKHGLMPREMPCMPPSLPLGKVLGIVEVVDGCHFRGVSFPQCMPITWWPHIGKHELSFGDFREGRGGLLLSSPRAFEEPIPARGMNGLWNWESSNDG